MSRSAIGCLLAIVCGLGVVFAQDDQYPYTPVSCTPDIHSNEALSKTAIPISAPLENRTDIVLPARCCLECESNPECWQWQFRVLTVLNYSAPPSNQTFLTFCTLFEEGQGIDDFDTVNIDPDDCVSDPCYLQEFRYSFKHDASGTCAPGQFHCGAGFCLNSLNVCDGVAHCRGHIGPLSFCNFTIEGEVYECPIDEVNCDCDEQLRTWNDGFTIGSSINAYRDQCTSTCDHYHFWEVLTQGTGNGSACNHTDGDLVIPLNFSEGVCSPGDGLCQSSAPTAVDTGASIDDPHFHGFGGGLFDVQGEPDKVFAIISGAHFQLNSLYLLQTEGFSADYHPEWAMSTYLGPMGVHLFDQYFVLYPDCSAKIDDVYFQRLTSGLLSKQLFSNGVQIGELVQSPSEFRLVVPGFQLNLLCTGHGGTAYFDLHAVFFRGSGLTPHGLLGQTADGQWRPTCGTCLQGEGAIDGMYTDYIVGSGEEALPSTDFLFSRFASSPATQEDAALFDRTLSADVKDLVSGSGFGSAGRQDVDPAQALLQEKANLFAAKGSEQDHPVLRAAIHTNSDR